MPNHVTNMIKADAKVISALLDDECQPDFNKIIPMPEELILEDSGLSHDAQLAAEQVWKLPVNESDLLHELKIDNFDMRGFELFVQMVKNKRNHGYFDDLEFAYDAWGTKCNAYDMDAKRSSETQLVFRTAWNEPENVFLELSKKFPKEVIQIDFADDDIGQNCGSYQLLNGNIISSEMAPPLSEQSTEELRKWAQFAFRLAKPNSDPIACGYNRDWDYVYVI